MVKKLSIIVPAFNEQEFINKTLRRVLAVTLPGMTREIIVVDDGSTDNTASKVQLLAKRHRQIRLIKKKNGGKGSAIKVGLKAVTGDVVVIQDADLEYDPKDYPLLMKPILEGDADVVYGSRFMGDRPHRVLFFWHMVANNLLTLTSNMFTNINLTDMETGYKMFTIRVAKRLDLKESNFGIEPEFTAKVARMGCRIFEVGISYHGRSYEEGKKIGIMDGFWGLWCILKYNLFG